MQQSPSRPDDHVLGIDIGGSFIKAALVDLSDGHLVSKTIRQPTPQPGGPEQVRAAIADVMHTLDWKGALGVGYPGVVKRGICLSAANVSSEWLNLNITGLLAPLTGAPVAVLNDADAAGLAEMQFGAGRAERGPDGRVVLLLTLGTGIGTAFFYRGQLFPNTEFGHIELDGVDAEINAAASVRTRQNLSWPDWSRQLNHYLDAMEKLVSPDLIILGGGISENADHFLPRLSVKAELRVAELGNTAGLIGAAMATRTAI
jgi:polyphosphate glucokinase